LVARPRARTWSTGGQPASLEADTSLERPFPKSPARLPVVRYHRVGRCPSRRGSNRRPSRCCAVPTRWAAGSQVCTRCCRLVGRGPSGTGRRRARSPRRPRASSGAARGSTSNLRSRRTGCASRPRTTPKSRTDRSPRSRFRDARRRRVDSPRTGVVSSRGGTCRRSKESPWPSAGGSNGAGQEHTEG
jgi:hypothetical protein